jgi:hypothetical protein
LPFFSTFCGKTFFKKSRLIPGRKGGRAPVIDSQAGAHPGRRGEEARRPVQEDPHGRNR